MKSIMCCMTSHQLHTYVTFSFKILKLIFYYIIVNIILISIKQAHITSRHDSLGHSLNYIKLLIYQILTIPFGDICIVQCKYTPLSCDTQGDAMLLLEGRKNDKYLLACIWIQECKSRVQCECPPTSILDSTK